MILVYRDNDNPFKRSTQGASGFDLCAKVCKTSDDGVWVVPARGRRLVDTGAHFAIPRGLEGQVRPRSGIANSDGVIAATGTIDSDYRGEVRINLFNHSDNPFRVYTGQRVAQIVFAPVWLEVEVSGLLEWETEKGMRFVETLDDLPKTNRGANGFGSTGR